MSDYCTCCTTNIQHIQNHYDPSGLTKQDDNSRDLLALFRACFDEDGPCPLTLSDVQEYIDSTDEPTETE